MTNFFELLAHRGQGSICCVLVIFLCSVAAAEEQKCPDIVRYSARPGDVLPPNGVVFFETNAHPDGSDWLSCFSASWLGPEDAQVTLPVELGVDNTATAGLLLVGLNGKVEAGTSGVLLVYSPQQHLSLTVRVIAAEAGLVCSVQKPEVSKKRYQICNDHNKHTSCDSWRVSERYDIVSAVTSDSSKQQSVPVAALFVEGPGGLRLLERRLRVDIDRAVHFSFTANESRKISGDAVFLVHLVDGVGQTHVSRTVAVKTAEKKGYEPTPSDTDSRTQYSGCCSNALDGCCSNCLGGTIKACLSSFFTCCMCPCSGCGSGPKF